jgi:hypothetical protein
VKFKSALLSAALVVSASPTFAQMTVADLKKIYDQQGSESPIGISYTQGVFEGLIGLEAVRRREGQTPTEFCGVFDLISKGKAPDPHIATLGPWLIEGWEKQGQDINAPFVDLMLSYLSGTYGCK